MNSLLSAFLIVAAISSGAYARNDDKFIPTPERRLSQGVTSKDGTILVPFCELPGENDEGCSIVHIVELRPLEENRSEYLRERFNDQSLNKETRYREKNGDLFGYSHIACLTGAELKETTTTAQNIFDQRGLKAVRNSFVPKREPGVWIFATVMGSAGLGGGAATYLNHKGATNAEEAKWGLIFGVGSATISIGTGLLKYGFQRTRAKHLGDKWVEHIMVAYERLFDPNSTEPTRLRKYIYEDLKDSLTYRLDVYRGSR